MILQMKDREIQHDLLIERRLYRPDTVLARRIVAGEVRGSDLSRYGVVGRATNWKQSTTSYNMDTKSPRSEPDG